MFKSRFRSWSNLHKWPIRDEISDFNCANSKLTAPFLCPHTHTEVMSWSLWQNMISWRIFLKCATSWNMISWHDQRDTRWDGAVGETHTIDNKLPNKSARKPLSPFQRRPKTHITEEIKKLCTLPKRVEYEIDLRTKPFVQDWIVVQPLRLQSEIPTF